MKGEKKKFWWGGREFFFFKKTEKKQQTIILFSLLKNPKNPSPAFYKGFRFPQAPLTTRLNSSCEASFVGRSGDPYPSSSLFGSQKRNLWVKRFFFSALQKKNPGPSLFFFFWSHSKKKKKYLPHPLFILAQYFNTTNMHARQNTYHGQVPDYVFCILRLFLCEPYL